MPFAQGGQRPVGDLIDHIDRIERVSTDVASQL